MTALWILYMHSSVTSRESSFPLFLMIDTETQHLALKIWEYHRMHHTLRRSDAILVLGSHDTRVAERGAELYLGGWAPILIFSGGL